MNLSIFERKLIDFSYIWFFIEEKVTDTVPIGILLLRLVLYGPRVRLDDSATDWRQLHGNSFLVLFLH